MEPEQSTIADGELVATWKLPYSARLGSSLRSKGIFQYVRLRLPATARRALSVKAGELTLRLPEGGDAVALAAVVSDALEGIETRPLLPREIEREAPMAKGWPPQKRGDADRQAQGTSQ